MKGTLLALILALGLFNIGKAQCSLDIPQDTVTLFWGYDPMACAILSPVITGAAPVQFLWSNGATSASIQVCDTASIWYFVTLTDDTACQSMDSVFVNVVDVRCGNHMNKVAVCHIPPGNPANAHTICISENGVPAHLAHGCHLGPCYTPPVGPVTPVTGTIQLAVSPNPVSTVSQVTVTSMVAQHITLTVIDATGRRLSVLLDADMISTEQRTVALDNSDLPKGTSMFWIEAKSSSDVKLQRVVLLR